MWALAMTSRVHEPGTDAVGGCGQDAHAVDGQLDRPQTLLGPHQPNAPGLGSQGLCLQPASPSWPPALLILGDREGREPDSR